jgi:hypothetical protein
MEKQAISFCLETSVGGKIMLFSALAFLPMRGNGIQL